MQKITLLIMAALVASTSFAQEKSESVDDILKELGNHQGVEASSFAKASADKPVDLVEPAVAEPAPAPVVEVEEVSPVAEASASAEATADVMEDVDVEELIAESRDYYVGGEFARAQAGFEKAVQVKPENMIARMYLRKLIERDQRIEKMGLSDAEGAVDVEVKFPEVKFKKGSSAVYQPAMEKLFVRNTRDNLLIIEEILDAMDVAKLSADVEQVEIEAKFVEVSEGTLEELGFEWSPGVNADGNRRIDLFGDVETGGGDQLFDDGLRGGATGPDMPFSRPNEMGATSEGVSGDWSAFRFEDTFSKDPDTLRLRHDGHVPLDVVISALDQSSGADVLSAPRIVTKSGETATIRVGQLHTYPEIYEVGASAGNIVHIKYEDWEEMLLGVELEVTPQVDGDQIELGLNPKFRELQGWQSYDVASADSAYTFVQEDISQMLSTRK